MARHLKVPVIVGEDRHQAGLAAEQKLGAQWHILDDGFQHRALARDFDIVLLMPQDLDDRLLPAGRMRERLSSSRRGRGLNADGAEGFRRMASDVDAMAVASAAVKIYRRVWVDGLRVQIFFDQLRAAGIEPVAEAWTTTVYTERDIQELMDLRRSGGKGGGFVTTEKDEINLGSHLSKLDPLTVVPVQMELRNAPNAVDTLCVSSKAGKRPA